MERYDERYDAALLGILQNEEKIENFLHVIMGFLHRRTDFYRIMESKESKLGFPPGVAKKILLNVFQQYEQNAFEDTKIKQAQKQKQKATESKRKVSEDSAPKIIKSQSTKADETLVDDNEIAANSTADRETSSNHSTSESPESSKNESEDPMETSCTDKIQTNAHTDKSELKTDEEPMTEEEAKLKKQQEYFQSKPDSYNGAVRDSYSWSQTITDVDVRVKVPSYIKKGKEVQVDLGKKHLKVSHKDQSGQWVEVASGELTWEVHHAESIWSLVPGEHIHINMEKKQERWWEGLLTSEPKINVRSIDCSRPMSDLDDEAQVKIQEMMYNEQQKRCGLPQTHETKMHDMLKKAWDAEGSPFKGQPFDPSKFNVDPSGVMTMKDT